jgi:hypothetical protein
MFLKPVTPGVTWKLANPHINRFSDFQPNCAPALFGTFVAMFG